jgi:putative intracellular protease/amidase
MLLAARGTNVQEALKPLALLEQAGCPVTLAGLDGGTVRFDPLCNLLAVFESPWDPTWRLLRQARRDGRLDNLASLRDLERNGGLDAWLDGFAGLIVPGGHGEIFNAFLRNPLVLQVVGRFLAQDKALALICHAPIIATLVPSEEKPLARGRTITCWPRGYERAFSLLPVIGRYLVPCGRPVGDLLSEAGATVVDSVLPWRRVHAAIDGRLITGRGPWSSGAVAAALLDVLSA